MDIFSMCIGCGSAAPEAKLADPRMTTADNPLASGKPDPLAARNAVMEIRAGTGGEEAALFAGDLFRMYSRYAETAGWRISVMNENKTSLDGYKEIVFTVVGDGAYGRLRFESGGHRVQRVPETHHSFPL